MMILTKLSLKNFKKYKNFEIDFYDGLTGIIGKNGSGKSTVFEAILFALYGELKSKGSKELVKNVRANSKDELIVLLEFEFDNLDYKVVREFRGKNLNAIAKLYKNNELIVNGAKDVTRYIINMTKMTKDAFLNTLFASQKELTSLSSLDNEHRKKMIRKLLGLEKIDQIEKFLKESISDLNKEIKSFSSFLLNIEQVDEYETHIKSYQESLKILKEKINLREEQKQKLIDEEKSIKEQLIRFEKIKEQKNDYQNKIKLYESKLESTIKNINELQTQKTQLEAKKEEYKIKKIVKNEYEKIVNNLKQQDDLKEKYLKKIGLIKERDELRLAYKKQKDEIKFLEEEIVNVNSVQLEQKELKDKIKLYQKQLQDKKIDERELRDKIAGEQNLIKDTKSKIQTIQSLGKNSKCPTCTRELLDDYDKVLNSLYELIEKTYEKNIYIYESKLEELNKRIEIKQDEYDKTVLKEKDIHSKLNILNERKKDLLKSKSYLNDIETRGKGNNEAIEKLQEYVYDKKLHEDMIEKFQNLKVEYEYLISLEAQLQGENKLLISLKEAVKEKESLVLKISQLKNDEKEILYDENTHILLKKNLDETLRKKDDLTELLYNKKLQESKINGEINSINNRLKENEEQKIKLQVKIEDLNDYTKLKLSMAEFKTNINSKIAPKISQIASIMYSKITKGKYQFIEVSNDFDFYIYDDGKKYPIERFSGGEVDLANLVLRIAISKTLMELNGSSQIGFLAFDEVFGSQDETRRLEILEAFHTIKEQYRQIFLISHETEIKEMFERLIEV
ncbi:SbcCD-like exonuclease, ATPase subunit [Malaciobacter marinus]|uniref:SbcCD-like exonuclease, ATPase subunit n=2 Tax=Malaciobacter marinus TaxID=505249 RepID=A0A347TMB4_9BACT|nr:SMC family ATPase [Malaciobacter marinus]AXX87742.1 SbcCD-like exonuclease, ATPase subunit [Malaciobacter marinus]